MTNTEDKDKEKEKVAAETSVEDVASDSVETSQGESAEEKSSEDKLEKGTPHPNEGEAKWYVVHTQSGFEKKAQESLRQRVTTLGLEGKIFDIIVPMRDIVAIKSGKKKAMKEKVFPGYILIKMIIDDRSWIAVQTTQGITGFVGTGTKPTPIREKDVKAIMQFLSQDHPKFKTKFSVGEPVKITDGPLSDLIGSIEHIDEAKGKVRVLIRILGRETPTELDLLQVAKL